MIFVYCYTPSEESPQYNIPELWTIYLTKWKQAHQSKRALIREAGKRPKVTLEEVQRFKAQVEQSVDRTINNHAIHRTGH